MLDEFVGATIAVTGADMGNIRLLDPRSASLEILAHRGFERPGLDFWNRVHEGHCTCGTALERGERVIVADITERVSHGEASKPAEGTLPSPGSAV